ncbi:HvfC/BufC N-terminal domain-containing protein [Acidimangrovimonas sediminis]|uniref:HvfC/BufC N-terminal domain-containing protein n=1 Tax=Acidimangrovimonas sediminis TaxID=2056283 RepID=UPI001304D1E4|nr:DNA-binding domain-containing protein [Acidimangrovimonas sediminis]
MPPFAERLAEFGAALLDPEAAVPPGLVGPDGQPSARRFAVYRNNVAAGLTGALTAAYPAAARLVGADFFRAAARIFALSHPPDGPVMARYGAGFAAFLEGFPPLAGYPYVACVARIERARLVAYHAPEAAPLAPGTLATLAPAALPGLRLVLHPSVGLVRSPYPAGSIWQAQQDTTPGALPDTALPDPVGPEDVVIARPGAEVVLRILPPGGAAFLTALQAGATLADAAEAALAEDPRADIASLAGLPFALELVTGLGGAP